MGRFVEGVFGDEEGESDGSVGGGCGGVGAGGRGWAVDL